MCRNARKTVPISIASAPERQKDALVLKAKQSSLSWAGASGRHFVWPNLSAARQTNPWINLSSLWRADWDTLIPSLQESKWPFFGRSLPRRVRWARADALCHCLKVFVALSGVQGRSTLQGVPASFRVSLYRGGLFPLMCVFQIPDLPQSL